MLHTFANIIDYCKCIDSVDSDLTALIGAVLSVPRLFDQIDVIVFQQMPEADDICIDLRYMS